MLWQRGAQEKNDDTRKQKKPNQLLLVRQVRECVCMCVFMCYSLSSPPPFHQYPFEFLALNCPMQSVCKCMYVFVLFICAHLISFRCFNACFACLVFAFFKPFSPMCASVAFNTFYFRFFLPLHIFQSVLLLLLLLLLSSAAAAGYAYILCLSSFSLVVLL